MKDTIERHIDIELNGQAMRLRMDLGALHNFKKAAGKEFTSIMVPNTAVEIKAMRKFENATGKSVKGLDIDNTTDAELDALIELEKDIGASYTSLSRLPDLDDVGLIIWACLLHENPKLTPGEVRSWLYIQDLGYYVGRISELARKVSPETKEGSEAPLA